MFLISLYISTLNIYNFFWKKFDEWVSKFYQKPIRTLYGIELVKIS